MTFSKYEYFFRPSTTTTPIPTSATKDVVTNNKVEEPLSSPYFPDIPDLIAQGAAEDTSKNYDVSANSASVAAGTFCIITLLTFVKTSERSERVNFFDNFFLMNRSR